MMPARPLFSTSRAQDAVVAAVMLCVLLGSLGLAYAMTSRAAEQRAVSLVRVEIPPDLQLVLPQTWTQAPVTDLPPKIEGARRFVDPDRPSRRLTLVRVVAPQPVNGLFVVNRVLPALLDEQALGSIDMANPTVYQRPRMQVAEWVGVSETGEGDAATVRTHLAADLTVDGRVHWLLYLTDTAAKDESPRRVLLVNLGLLRSLHQSAVLGSPSDAASPTPTQD